MSELSHADVADILALLREADFEHFDLQIGDVHLVASRHSPPAGAPLLPAAGPPTVEPTTVLAVALEAEPTSPPAGAGAPAVSTGPASSPAVPPSRDSTISAPMVGTFYRGPRPGDPAFVEIGQHVDADVTVGLIEVMKMFTAVPAGAAGIVVACLVADGQFVEFGQPLFTIDRSGT